MIGGIPIECYVLENEQRVVVASGLANALDIKNSNSSQRYAITQLFRKLALEIADDPSLRVKVENPIRFKRPGKGGSPALGYPADIMADICNAILKMGERTLVHIEYPEAAKRARVLLDGFARVGIQALVDEATGFQYARERDALQKILDRYLLEAHAAWAKRFPDEFYRLIYELKRWELDPNSTQRPSIVGTITKDIVYSRLAPGVLKELEQRNPPVRPGVRKHRHHQWLTEEIGHPELQKHLSGVTALMRAAESWEDFQRTLARAYPKLGEQHLLDVYRDFEEERQ